MKYEIVKAQADYTGGNIYVYIGELSNGYHFMTGDLVESVLILDADPNDDYEEAFYLEWQESHKVTELFKMEAYRFFTQIFEKVEMLGCDKDVRVSQLKEDFGVKEYSVTLLTHQNATVKVEATSEDEAREIAECMDCDKYEYDDSSYNVEAIDICPTARLPFTGEPLYNLLKGKVKELVRNTLSEYGIDWIDDLSFSNRHFLRNDTAMLAKALQLTLENPSADMDDTDD